MHSPIGLEDCVAVASGTRSQVEHWGELLRKAKIPFEIRIPCEEATPTRGDHAELWVSQTKADRSRSVLCADAGAAVPVLW